MDVSCVTNDGLEINIDRLLGNGSEPKYIGWGTGTKTASKTDKGLQTAGVEERVIGISSKQTIDVDNDTYQVIGTITCLGIGKQITEVALFDALIGGRCFSRSTFDPISIGVGDSIQFTLKTKYS